MNAPFFGATSRSLVDVGDVVERGLEFGFSLGAMMVLPEDVV
jgi:hypothetical protein